MSGTRSKDQGLSTVELWSTRAQPAGASYLLSLDNLCLRSLAQDMTVVLSSGTPSVRLSCCPPASTEHHSTSIRRRLEPGAT